jgi:hypothetical protein
VFCFAVQFFTWVMGITMRINSCPVKCSRNVDESGHFVGAVSAGYVVLEFSPAYIHQSVGAGTGWAQRAVVRVRGDAVSLSDRAPLSPIIGMDRLE